MSFNEVLEELPRLTFEERQLLIRIAVELNNTPLSAADEELITTRTSEHHLEPDTSIELDELKENLRFRLKP
jgi:hypothetical protein